MATRSAATGPGGAVVAPDSPASLKRRCRVTGTSSPAQRRRLITRPSNVADVGLLTANDEAIFNFAVAEDLVLVTADSDFPMMLALRGAGRPGCSGLTESPDSRSGTYQSPESPKCVGRSQSSVSPTAPAR
jgi:hypothetical protein